ncbi:group II intron maturase-specific domain-containing protein [Streptomyces sp. NPDC001292]|uniref:group II intron maturase-specific domain-containing protein n=1 Tax=Streptomyces sp. NPDC001292 TaxID=3364558 RepID=UPI00368BAE63
MQVIKPSASHPGAADVAVVTDGSRNGPRPDDRVHLSSVLNESAQSRTQGGVGGLPQQWEMPKDDHTESLRAAERRLQAAQLNSDVDALTELIDDAGQFIGPDGNLYSKRDDLRAHEVGHQVSALDERLQEPWKDGGTMGTAARRVRRRAKGLPNWKISRYADDLVVLVHGSRADVEDLQHEVTEVLEPLGLRLSPAKTRIVHMSEAFDFLGFRIQWKRKRGTDKWYVYTFIADRPIRSLKDRIRALTRRKSQQNPKAVLARLNLIMHGWANYFRHAVCKHTLSNLANFVWWRVVKWMQTLHRWRWKDVRRWLRTPDGSWKPISVDGAELFDMAAVPVTRYRYRGNKIPNPWVPA